MTQPSRTAVRDLYTQAAASGVAPLLLDGSPWAVRPDLLPQLAHAARMPAMAGFTTKAADAPASQPVAGVAVIPLTGIITPHGSFFDFLFGGGGGLVGFRDAFTEAVNSPDVSAIVIDVDSPGGLVDLVPETAAVVRAARGTKPIVAIADTLMASAAYWIAAQADEIVSTPSGYAGSVGVYRVHQDWSKFNEEFGVAVTYVHAGRYKVEGNSDNPLDDEAREQWQSDVDDAYALFVADVAAGRGIDAATVIANYGEGRDLNATRALEAGIVDRIATYDDVVAGLLGTPSGGETSAAAVRRLATEIAERQVALLQAQLDSPHHQLDAETAAAATAAAVRAALGIPPEADTNTEPEPEPEPERVAMSDDDRAAVAALLLAG